MPADAASRLLQRRAAAAQEFAHFMGQVVKLPELPVGVAMAGGLAVFEVYGWFVVGEIIGKRQLIGLCLSLFSSAPRLCKCV
jgi:hypothetical protein